LPRPWDGIPAGRVEECHDHRSQRRYVNFKRTFRLKQYLAACRRPDGFICPRCGHQRAYELATQRRRQCADCRHQVSLTSGTNLHRTKIPVVYWFWTAYLMTTGKRGVSAPLIQRQLGPSRYDASQTPPAYGE
jgi:hypothetical protein